MTYGKIKALNDVYVYVGSTAVPGVISFSEKSTGSVYGIHSFGDSLPTAYAAQNSRHAVRLEVLDFDGLDGLFGESGFELRISDGQSNTTYTNCSVTELVRGTDRDNRIIAAISITAENKTKDVS